MTVIVNTFCSPKQTTPAFEYLGVTVMVATTGEFPLFMAVKEIIFPVPIVANPTDGVSFDQL